jgi:hypothetical protein
MRLRSLTTLFAALAAIATTAAISMAAAGAGPNAHTASHTVFYSYNSIGRFRTAGLHVQTVQCAVGKKLTGGGVILHGTGGVVHSSGPTAGIDGWRATVQVPAAAFVDMQIQVYALCSETI